MLARTTGAPAGARRREAANACGQPAFEELRHGNVRRADDPSSASERRDYTPPPPMTARFVTAAVAAAAIVMLGRWRHARRRSWSRAFPSSGRRAARTITGAVRAGDADATAVELNPGAPRPVARRQPGAGGRRRRRGRGDPAARRRALLGHPDHRRQLAWAGAVAGRGRGRGRHRRAHDFRLGYALRLGRSSALGAAWAHRGVACSPAPTPSTWGSRSASGRYVAFGAVVEDVAGAAPPFGVALPRLWTAELAVRPIGHPPPRAGDRRVARRRRRLAPGGAARASVAGWSTRGLRLYGDAQTSPPTGTTTYAFESDSDLRIGVRHGAGSGPRRRDGGRGTSTSPGSGTGGMRRGRAPLRVEAQRRAAVVSPAYVARVKLEGSTTIASSSRWCAACAALAADRGGRGRVVQDRGHADRLARIEELRDLMAAAARQRQTDVRLRAVAVDARVLPGGGDRRRRGAPGGRRSR